MRTMKYFLVLVLILGLCQFTVAEKRKDKKTMEELTDPASPSYVPIPYPKNKKEIEEDLKYAISKLFSGQWKSVDGKMPKIREILLQFVEGSPDYKIGKVLKIKNRSHRMADDYSWLILIMGNNGEIAARLGMLANGLMTGGGPTGQAGKYFKGKYPNSRRGPQYLKTEQEAVDRLAEDLGWPVKKNKIKKIERVAFDSPLGSRYFPMLEIKMSDGKVYYYSVKRDIVYEAEDRIPWKKGKKGSRKSPWEMIPPDRDYLPDSISDEILVLKKMKSKK